MNNMRKSIIRIFWLIFLMFAAIFVSLIKTNIIDGTSLARNPYNPRLNYYDTSIKTGSIKDINGEVIAESIQGGNGYIRNYPRSRMAAHITGYSGNTGIEAAEHFEMQKVHNEIFQRLRRFLNKTEVQGNNVILTIDMNIQSIAGNLLGSKKGAIVVIEPSTGRILALQAYPDYNPNNVNENWESLSIDENSPLLNRSTQGLYPPGSTFKIITALAAMEYLPDWQTFTYNCKGEEVFEDKVIHCFNNKVHGNVDINKAMANSCNCFFAEIAVKIGAEKLRLTAEKCGLNKNIPFELYSNDSSISILKDSTESELTETGIGQGKTLVTPLYMAVFASAIANDGIMRIPYIVDHIEDYNGKELKTTLPKIFNTIMTSQQANKLTEMMIEVVKSGTGTAASVNGIQVAGKTGTAENSQGTDHSWFIGFAPADNPQIAVAVLLENPQGNEKAAPIAGKLIRDILNK